ncbi:hypothetical protein BV25DRAFT_1843233 [Artomyces pyxidatus]|uniref:Uncharacterized protein n=1 Tax=Artomyces pyxidatus TaxID=48021 RepID=A0ACB8SGI5_9AGAM|nr:hypothetical protein BV25DRAFT_1843233 [Artomyces pyxidatus]
MGADQFPRGAGGSPVPPGGFGCQPPLEREPVAPQHNTTSSSVAGARSAAAALSASILTDGAKFHKDSYIYLAGLSLGERWDTCVELYFRFEKKHGYQDNGVRLGNGTRAPRPSAIAYWIKRGRPFQHINIDLPTIGRDFWAWIHGLVPASQVAPDGRLVRTAGGNWDELVRPGINGCLSIVALLAWWGSELAGMTEYPRSARDAYEGALEDIIWVLELIGAPAFSVRGTKRPAASPAVNPSIAPAVSGAKRSRRN